MQAITNSRFQIEWVWTKNFPGRVVPLVILEGGKPGYVINQWIYDQIETGITPSLLEQRLHAVMQLYEFYCRKYGTRQVDKLSAQRLLADFLTAKKFGTVDEPSGDPLGFNWKPNLNRESLQRYVAAITAFDKWQATYHGADRMNPDEDRFLSAWERYSDFSRRTKWDPMLHLFSAKSHKEAEHKFSVREEHARFYVSNKRLPKAFPLEQFVDLVERTPSPRDQMLLLLMGGGSLRQSEPLHLFYSDVVGIDMLGQPRIRLADPERGEISWDKNGEKRAGTRTEYLHEIYANDEFKYSIPALYRLQPRTMGQRGRDHVGFKGMTFGDDPQVAISADGRQIAYNELFWIDPHIGYKFWLAYEEYVAEIFHKKQSNWPYHPWLFVNLDRDGYGMPMTLAALRKMWNRALKRLGLGDCGLAPHSLRHMYGYYCASVLSLPIEVTMLLMHHAKIESTRTYYHLRSDEVRNIILRSIAKKSGRNIDDYLIFPGAPRPAFPSHWRPQLTVGSP